MARYLLTAIHPAKLTTVYVDATSRRTEKPTHTNDAKCS